MPTARCVLCCTRCGTGCSLRARSILGAQLPMVIRGLYYEGWRLTEKPSADHTIDEFCATVAKHLPPNYPMDARTLAHGVFQVMFDQLDPGETAKVIDQLPVPLRRLWPEIARRPS